MTKKDYELFACEINKHVNNKDSEFDFRKVVDIVGDVLGRDNPNFDWERFEGTCYNGKHIRKSTKT